MAQNTLKCTSSGYSYMFSGVSQTGTGIDEASARAAALAKFLPDTESTTKVAAINAAKDENKCDGDCKLDVVVGEATFVQTNFDPATKTATVTVQVPVTLSCKRRQVVVAALASFGDDPVQAAAVALGSVPVGEVGALSQFRERLSAIGVEVVGDLLKRAGASGAGKQPSDTGCC